MYQTADIGTKAITKAEDWLRLQRLMMIKQKGPISGSGEPAAKIGENKTNKTTTFKYIVPIDVAQTFIDEYGSIQFKSHEDKTLQCQQCDNFKNEMAGCDDCTEQRPRQHKNKSNRRGNRGRANCCNTPNTWEVCG
jgi:hypothetical protein